MRRAWLLVSLVGGLTLAPACTCANSFVPPMDAGDAAVDATDDAHVEPPLDLGHDMPDLSNFDAGDCSEVAGYRRCTPSCALSCTGPTVCNPRLGLCVTREPDGSNESCGFRLTMDAGVSTQCPNGEPCALGVEYAGWAGLCIGPDRPAGLCAAGADAGLFQCVYGDGTPYVNGPATAPPCQPGTTMTPTCDGVCPGSNCPDTYIDPERPDAIGRLGGGCRGINEQRSYGTCLYSGFPPCLSINPLYLDGCALTYGAPCACLSIANAAGGAQTYLIEAAACRLYAAAFPDTIACLRPDGSPLD